MRVSLVAVGSNVTSQFGTPWETLEKLQCQLAADSSWAMRWSNFYATPAFPPGSGPEFVNAAFLIENKGEPHAILDALHAIETQFGRERKDRWGPRALDLDLIACGDTVLPELETYRFWKDLDPQMQRSRTPAQLILPHPRLQDRAFVLQPLADIAPDWRHPVLGMTVLEMLDARPAEERAAIRQL